ncbi:MAG: lysophospholipase [Gemmatimonadales bacterium]|jgi:alpha-beta hydrolase superfamily lysophospholipase
MPAFGDVEFWTAPDGARLALRRLEPASAPRALVLILHGFGDHSGRYAFVAEWLAARGSTVWALDQRGHGRSPGPRGHMTRFAQYLADVAALRRRAAAEVPAPQILLGHSFGGLVALRYLETAPQGLAGTVVTSPFIAAAHRPATWKLAVARALAGPLPGLGMFTGLDAAHLSTDPAVGQAARSDPLYHSRMTPAAWREIQAAQAAVVTERDRITGPLLILLAGDDRIASTPAAEALARTLPAETIVYDGMFHEILNERDRARVLADIGAWLDRVVPARAASASPGEA